MSVGLEFFVPLPLDFDQLAHAVRQRRGASLGAQVDLRSVGERTYSAFEAVAFSPLSPADHPQAPRQRDWRNLPHALWLSPEHGLHMHIPLAKHYLQDTLPAALATRRPLKWARAVLHP